MIEGHEIVIDLGYRVIRFPISAIEYFSHTNHRGITVIKIKIRGKRKKRLLNLCNQEEMNRFNRYINSRIGKY